MDHATLTDSHGRKADFRHVILIMTTNAGARDLSDRHMGFAEHGKGGSSRGALERMFTPEFRNRLDAIVNFNALDHGNREGRGQADRRGACDGCRQARHDRARPCGAGVAGREGFDRAFGARPMARLIERVIKKPPSELLLFGSLAEGGGAVVVDGENIRLVTGDQPA